MGKSESHYYTTTVKEVYGSQVLKIYLFQLTLDKIIQLVAEHKELRKYAAI
jgi:hypothetical protein